MKSLWQLMVGILVIHALALVALAAWLGASGRFSGDRIRAVADTFRYTIAEQVKLDAQSALEAERQLQDQRNSERLRSVGAGRVTVADRLKADRRADELSLQRVQWIARATSNLTMRLERDKAIIAQQKAKLDADRAALTAEADAKDDQNVNNDFQLAVERIEQLEPAVTKQMFQQLIDQGQMDQVIEYLVAMQLRKAGEVLREFKTPSELGQVKELIQRLRHRGIETQDGDGSGRTGSA